MAARNVAAFAGYDVVVADAAGCAAHLKDLGHWAEGGAELAGRVKDVTEVVALLIDSGHLPELSGDRGDVAVQDPCHLRHAQRIVREPRRILEAAGYRPVEIDPAGMCCGAAGIYMVLEAETSRPARAAEGRSGRAPPGRRLSHRRTRAARCSCAHTSARSSGLRTRSSSIGKPSAAPCPEPQR